MSVHLARLTGWFLLLAWVTLILGITLGQRHSGYHAVNLRPGASIRLELHEVDPRIGVTNIVGNVALFVPLGFLLVTALRDGIPRATLGGGLLSATIECCQHQIGRAADIDDVLLNTSGALFGALIAVALAWTLVRLRRLASWLGLSG